MNHGPIGLRVFAEVVKFELEEYFVRIDLLEAHAKRNDVQIGIAFPDLLNCSDKFLLFV